MYKEILYISPRWSPDQRPISARSSPDHRPPVAQPLPAHYPTGHNTTIQSRIFGLEFEDNSDSNVRTTNSLDLYTHKCSHNYLHLFLEAWDKKVNLSNKWIHTWTHCGLGIGGPGESTKQKNHLHWDIAQMEWGKWYWLCKLKQMVSKDWKIWISKYKWLHCDINLHSRQMATVNGEVVGSGRRVSFTQFRHLLVKLHRVLPFCCGF